MTPSALTCPKCNASVAQAAKFCDRCGTPLGSQPLMFGDYEVTEVIGEGGMGRVYKAIQPRLNRAVCIKTLLPQFSSDPQVVRRFEKEATTMAALSHPNIVSVFDVGRTTDGAAFIVMELIDGRPLRVVLRDESPVPYERAVRLIDQVLAALAEAHLHGTIHRDLKPGNVIVVPLRDGSELVKVLDFGIARTLDVTELDDPLTKSGMMLGTPGYMAPEQLAGEPYDSRIDLYAAGALLYELVSGRRVFRAANDAELRRKALFETPLPPSSVTALQVPLIIDEICLKALARSASERYQTANEFREALALVSRSGFSGVSPMNPAFEYTPLAVAPTSSSSGIFSTNSRALVAQVLEATSDWERSHLLESYVHQMHEYTVAGDVESVRSAIKVLQVEQKAPQNIEALKTLFDATRKFLIDALPTLFEWLKNEPTRRGAQWLLRVLGPTAVSLYLDALPALDPETQQHLLGVIKAIDPTLSGLLTLLRTTDAKALKPVLIAARNWPDDQNRQVFVQLLQGPDPSARQVALESLDERMAFRLALVIRQRLHDPVVSVRNEALRWVFRLEDEDAVNDLSKLLERAISAIERRSVWRVLSHLKTEEAVSLLIGAINGATHVDAVSELALLLVRTRSQRAIGHVERMAAGPSTSAKFQKVMEEALRETRNPSLAPAPISRITPMPRKLSDHTPSSMPTVVAPRVEHTPSSMPIVTKRRDPAPPPVGGPPRLELTPTPQPIVTPAHPYDDTIPIGPDAPTPKPK